MMYVLIWVDEINDLIGPQSITSRHEIMAVSPSVDELKRIAAENGDQGTLDEWDTNDDGIMVAKAMYDNEVEEEQYFLIIPVE